MVSEIGEDEISALHRELVGMVIAIIIRAMQFKVLNSLPLLIMVPPSQKIWVKKIKNF